MGTVLKSLKSRTTKTSLRAIRHLTQPFSRPWLKAYYIAKRLLWPLWRWPLHLFLARAKFQRKCSLWYPSISAGTCRYPPHTFFHKGQVCHAQAGIVKDTKNCIITNQTNEIASRDTPATAEHIVWACRIYWSVCDEILLSLGPLRPQQYREWEDPTGRMRRKAGEALRACVVLVIHTNKPNHIAPGPHPFPTLPVNTPLSSNPFHHMA